MIKKILILAAMFCCAVGNAGDSIELTEYVKRQENLWPGAPKPLGEIDSVSTNKYLGFLYSKKQDYPKPKILEFGFTVSSSSNQDKYFVENADDNKLETAWVAGGNNGGIKEWIRCNIHLEYNLKKRNPFYSPNLVVVYPGYGKNEKAFYDNNRIKTAILVVKLGRKNVAVYDKKYNRNYFDNKRFYRLKFKDEMTYQAFHVGEPCNETEYEYTLYVESIYQGRKYNDTCISEIDIWVENPDIYHGHLKK